MGVTLSVFFDDPFYIGLFERIEDGRLPVAKVVFGAEPGDGEVYDWLLENFFQLRFSPAIDGVKEVRIAANPKRRQRQAAKAGTIGVGTRSQQAMQLARDMAKEQRAVRSKELREADEARRYILRAEKKKARHRGH